MPGRLAGWITTAFHGSARAVAVPLAGIHFTQTSAVMSPVTVPVLATEIAGETGIGASKVGLYTSLIFGTSVASGGVVQRLGPIRTNQIALVFSATALQFTLTANPWRIAFSAVLIGAGYGPNTPSRSEVLSRVTPPRMRGLVYSIAPSGAPLGAMEGGLILPAMVAIGDWRIAIVTGALIVYAAAVARAHRQRRPLRRVHERMDACGDGARMRVRRHRQRRLVRDFPGRDRSSGTVGTGRPCHRRRALLPVCGDLRRTAGVPGDG